MADFVAAVVVVKPEIVVASSFAVVGQESVVELAGNDPAVDSKAFVAGPCWVAGALPVALAYLASLVVAYPASALIASKKENKH